MSRTSTAGATRARDVSGRTPDAGSGSRWTVLVVLCLSLLLVAVDATVLHVAVPAVTEDLRPGAVELLWIVDAYPLVAASLLILFGTLGDRVGRRRVLLCGYGCFGLASLLATLAGSPQTLIAARVLLGVGGAMIMPATLSILRQVFPDRRERALAIGVWSAVAAVGAAGGPLLGGFLLTHFWWGSVFLINIPLMVLAVPVGRWLLPESTGDRDGPWDVVGALMAAAGLFALVLGIKEAGSDPGQPAALAALGCGVVVLTLFVRRQLRLPHPLVDMRSFAQPVFGTAVGCIIIAMLALVGLQLIAAQYLQLVLGFSPLETGMRLLPLTFAAMAAGLAGSRLLQRLGPRTMVVSGFVTTAAAVLLLTAMGQEDRPTLLACGFVLLGCGLEITLFGAYESMLSEAPASQAGSVAAVGETSYQLGAGIGIALLGSVMNAVYGPRVGHVPGVPPDSSAAARDSLSAAYEVSTTLGGESGAALRAAARDAFVSGLHVALGVSALLLLGGAIAALRLPATVETPTDGAEPPAGADPAGAGEAASGRAAERPLIPGQGRPGEPDRVAARTPTGGDASGTSATERGTDPGTDPAVPPAAEAPPAEPPSAEPPSTTEPSPGAERCASPPRIAGPRTPSPRETSTDGGRLREPKEDRRERDGRDGQWPAGGLGHRDCGPRPGRQFVVSHPTRSTVSTGEPVHPPAPPGANADDPRPPARPVTRRARERGSL